MREYRQTPIGEVRTGDDGRHYFSARICNYNVPDTYSTSWRKGVFTKSLEKRLPTAVFSHDWNRPIGKVISFQEDESGLDVEVRMSDLNANPDAKRMYHHLVDGEIQEFSFAFDRKSEEPDPNHRGITRITEATMVEVSPTLVGAIPGTRLLSVRAEDDRISRVRAADILVKLVTGDMDLADALTALKAEGTGEGGPPPDVTNFPQPDSPKDTPEPVVVPQPPANTPKPEPDATPKETKTVLDDEETQEVYALLASIGRSALSPYGKVTYGDPGYQKDGVKRYPLDSKAHAKSAWSYINMPKNAEKYTPEQLAAIKARIKRACKKYGAEVSE